MRLDGLDTNERTAMEAAAMVAEATGTAAAAREKVAGDAVAVEAAEASAMVVGAAADQE